jgi:hypothetical protein
MKEFMKRSFLEKLNVWRIPGEGLYLHTFDGWLGGVEKHHTKSNQIRVLKRELTMKKLKVEKSKKAADQTDVMSLENKMLNMVQETGDMEEKLGDLRDPEDRARAAFFTEFLFPELVDPIPSSETAEVGKHEKAFQDWFDVKIEKDGKYYNKDT